MAGRAGRAAARARSSSWLSAARFTMVVIVCAASPVSRVASVFASWP